MVPRKRKRKGKKERIIHDRDLYNNGKGPLL
jgi:hypothetical protein